MVRNIFLLVLSTLLCFCSKNKANPQLSADVVNLHVESVRTSADPIAGTAFTGKLYISYSGGNGVDYEASTAIASTGVTGLTAVLQPGKLENGIGHLVYQLTGVATNSGLATFGVAFGSRTAQVQVEVKKEVAKTPLYWGFFDDSGTAMSFYNGFGKKPSMAMMFHGWNANGNRDFPIEFCQQADAGGYIPHITWEPMMGLTELMSGKYDADIRKYGQAIAKFGKPIILRFAHEFNGDWYPWSMVDEKLVPTTTYISAYRYVHQKIQEAGGTNAQWVWAPNVVNGGKNNLHLGDYYPGDAYVDWIGMDGYNFGTSQSWSRWQSFAEVFGDLYTWIEKVHPNKPIFISEMGTSATGGDKAAWITDMFYQLEHKFPNVKAFVWFNINKETDWRFTDNQNSVEAFKKGLSNGRVLTDSKLGQP